MTISKEDAIRVLLQETSDPDIIERLDRIESKLDLLLSAVVIRQKEACALLGVTDDTMRNMALRGEVDPLQADGSSRNYLTLKVVEGLKPRRQVKKKRK